MKCTTVTNMWLVCEKITWESQTFLSVYVHSEVAKSLSLHSDVSSNEHIKNQ
jgi:hypothetical protein